MQYGPITGSAEFKESLAEFLTKEYKEPVHAYVSMNRTRCSEFVCSLCIEYLHLHDDIGHGNGMYTLKGNTESYISFHNTISILS